MRRHSWDPLLHTTPKSQLHTLPTTPSVTHRKVCVNTQPDLFCAFGLSLWFSNNKQPILYNRCTETYTNSKISFPSIVASNKACDNATRQCAISYFLFFFFVVMNQYFIISVDIFKSYSTQYPLQSLVTLGVLIWTPATTKGSAAVEKEGTT